MGLQDTSDIDALKLTQHGLERKVSTASWQTICRSCEEDVSEPEFKRRYSRKTQS